MSIAFPRPGRPKRPREVEPLAPDGFVQECAALKQPRTQADVDATAAAPLRTWLSQREARAPPVPAAKW